MMGAGDKIHAQYVRCSFCLITLVFIAMTCAPTIPRQNFECKKGERGGGEGMCTLSGRAIRMVSPSFRL